MNGRQTLLLCVLLLGNLLSQPAQAEPILNDAEQRAALARYRDCVIHKVQPARSAVAASHLQQACQTIFAADKGGNAAKMGTRQLNMHEMQQEEQEKNRRFHECLLDYLPTVYNDQSAEAMVQLCREQFGTENDKPVSQARPDILLQLLGLRSDKRNKQPQELTIEGDTFVPLVPWQGGQPR
ncbi:MAG: hypothetical protein HQL80_06255 [Magnetococcales bacterium]|nr:hypothetical protein [Magnetococcales bacterium]